MSYKYLTLVAFLFFCLLTKSQSNALVFVSETGNPFFLKVNGNPINKEAQSIVKAFDIGLGWQIVEINTVISNSTFNLKDSIKINDKPQHLNKEFTYAVVLQEGKLKLAFKSVSELSGPQTPTIPIAPKEIIPLEDNSIYGKLYKAVNNKPQFFDNYTDSTDNCSTELTDKEILYAINLLSKCNDDFTKQNYLNQIIDNNCFNTNQIKQLIELFPTDIDRMNLAKKSYSHISDKENASLLLAILKYQSMKESYSNYIKDQENVIKQKNLKCSIPINENQFNEVFTKIKNGGYEYEKVIVAKKQLVNICLSTAQVKNIATLFTHDRETIEFLKSAYNVITDKENSKGLANELQFKESKEEFLKYISK